MDAPIYEFSCLGILRKILLMHVKDQFLLILYQFTMVEKLP